MFERVQKNAFIFDGAARLCPQQGTADTAPPLRCTAVSFISTSPHPREVDMSDDEYATPESRITAALAHARQARHHPDCNCRMFDRQFCNAADAWQQHASA